MVGTLGPVLLSLLEFLTLDGTRARAVWNERNVTFQKYSASAGDWTNDATWQAPEGTTLVISATTLGNSKILFGAKSGAIYAFVNPRDGKFKTPDKISLGLPAKDELYKFQFSPDRRFFAAVSTEQLFVFDSVGPRLAAKLASGPIRDLKMTNHCLKFDTGRNELSYGFDPDSIFPIERCDTP